ncbi:MAG: hypothetical protein IKC26_11110 [Clostridia bacterium]|nr:hypothetical protein [Clostridia bacterium]MBR2908575.1 hypothetical protein [Clostridia bacterium]
MEYSQICEHTVKQKLGGAQIALRIVFILLYTFILFVSTMLGLVWQALVPAITVAVLIDIPLFLVTWRKTRVEYEYTMTGGVLVFSRIYGGSARRVVFEQDMREIKAAFPYGSTDSTRILSKYAPEKQYFALSSQNADENRGKEIWCCIFEEEDEKTAAFYFELTDNAYRFLRTYAGSTTAKRDRSSGNT